MVFGLLALEADDGDVGDSLLLLRGGVGVGGFVLGAAPPLAAFAGGVRRIEVVDVRGREGVLEDGVPENGGGGGGVGGGSGGFHKGVRGVGRGDVEKDLFGVPCEEVGEVGGEVEGDVGVFFGRAAVVVGATFDSGGLC